MFNIEDHGLPLVQLKELRRELVMALVGRRKPISKTHIAEISSLQHAIAAMEAVIVDLDAENGIAFSQMQPGRFPLAAWSRQDHLRSLPGLG